MPILQILTSVVSAIAGSLTNGIIKLFRGKKELPSSPPPPPSPPSQHVLVAGPLALVSLQFALNPEIRDILEIPRGGPEQTSPRLILPGQGIVSVQQFIVEVADTLGMRAERKVECAYCHHERHHGAFANSNWVCLDCFKEHLSHLAEGRPEISSGTLWPARSWSWITQLLNGAQAIRALSSEPTVVALIRASKESSIEVQFNDIWLDHDVAHVDGRAIGIHVSFGIDGAWGRQCRASVFFYFEDGERLRDSNGLYRTSHGYTASSEEFSPSYPEGSLFENFVLYMPYAELHLDSGWHDLKLRVRISCSGFGVSYYDSGWVTFRCRC